MTSLIALVLTAAAGAAPAPAPASSSGPPPAYLTAHGDRTRMGQGSYCWTPPEGPARCVDYVAPGHRDDLPKIRLRAGDRVRFTVGFRPRSLSVSTSEGRTVRLPARRRTTWRVTGRPRWISLFARPRSGGDASYVVKVRR